jgi:hypothetical protein
MILQTMIPIIMPIDSGPISPEAVKTLKGIFIFLNFLYLIRIVSALYMYFKDREYYIFFGDTLFFMLLDIIVIPAWIMIILLFIGEFISKIFL